MATEWVVSDGREGSYRDSMEFCGSQVVVGRRWDGWTKPCAGLAAGVYMCLRGIVCFVFFLSAGEIKSLFDSESDAEVIARSTRKCEFQKEASRHNVRRLDEEKLAGSLEE